MLPTLAYAVTSPHAKFAPFHFERRELGPRDVLIKILYCGICHSDIHSARNEWANSMYPMVPGHEIVGQVVRVGSDVTKFKLDDTVGVGCFVDSCRTCSSCREGEEQFCEKHISFTYNGTEQDLHTLTYGGYSSQIVVDEHYVLKIASHLPLASIAPLLCAGITTYSPLRHFNVGPGHRVAVIGLGGLGHMGVKLAVAMGAEVTVFSRTLAKEQDAKRLGAHHFVATDSTDLNALANSFTFMLNTVSELYNPDQYLNLLSKSGVMVVVGIPEQPLQIHPVSLIMRRRMLAGSLIGGIAETQEMLDYCAEKNISSDVEIIPIQNIEHAYERIIKGDVRYRFVIDMNTLG